MKIRYFFWKNSLVEFYSIIQKKTYKSGVKKGIISILFTACVFSSFSQSENKKYDSSFLNIFSKISFQRTADNLPILRRWTQNIKLYIDGVESKEIKESLQKSVSIQKIQPLLNGITIAWASDMNEANYLVEIDTTGINHYYLSYDRDGNIYKCRITINKKISFSVTDQMRVIRNYFITSLGHFYFPRNSQFSSLKSCLYSLLNDISEFDEKVLLLEYSKDLRPGMSVKEFSELTSKWRLATK